MADGKREERSLRAKWRDRRAHPVETAEEAARVAQEADERARLKQARDIADVEIRGAGRRTQYP